MQYNYSTLKRALNDARSPLAQHLKGTFPHRRALVAQVRASATQRLVEPGTANPGTVGTAFDLTIRFTLNPGEQAQHGVMASSMLMPTLAAGLTNLVDVARTNAQKPDGVPDLVRAAWVLAAAEEVYRSGRVWPGSPLIELAENDVIDAQSMLQSVSPDAERQLTQLLSLAQDHLLPHLVEPVLGASFAASELCGAEADLIAQGLLIDVTTGAGKANRDGGHHPELAATDLNQILAYVLFDCDDAYSLRTAGFYLARFGAIVTWPLQLILNELAGRNVDLHAEREQVWSLLQSH